MFQGIKGSQTSSQQHFEVANNYLKDNFDHAYYGGGDYEFVHDNQIYHTQKKGAGTAIVGQGSFGQYKNNKIYSTTGGGITVRNAEHSEIVDNVMELELSKNFYGIVTQTLSGTYGNINYNKIKNNIINFTSTGSSDGVRVLSSGADSVCFFHLTKLVEI